MTLLHFYLAAAILALIALLWLGATKHR